MTSTQPFKVKHYLGPAVGFLFSDRSPVATALIKIPYTVFPIEDLYIRPSIGFVVDTTSGCKKTGNLVRECADPGDCSYEPEVVCSDKGRVGLGGGVGIGYRVFSTSGFSMGLGVLSDIGYYFARGDKEGDLFHSERGLIELMYEPTDSLIISFEATPGILCASDTGQTCNFTTGLGLALGWKL